MRPYSMETYEYPEHDVYNAFRRRARDPILAKLSLKYTAARADTSRFFFMKPRTVRAASEGIFVEKSQICRERGRREPQANDETIATEFTIGDSISK